MKLSAFLVVISCNSVKSVLCVSSLSEANVVDLVSGCRSSFGHPAKTQRHSWERTQLHPPRLSLSHVFCCFLTNKSPVASSIHLQAVSSPTLLPLEFSVYHCGGLQMGVLRVSAWCELADCSALWLLNVLGSWAAWSGCLMGANLGMGMQDALREDRDR